MTGWLHEEFPEDFRRQLVSWSKDLVRAARARSTSDSIAAGRFLRYPLPEGTDWHEESLELEISDGVLGSAM